MLFISGLSPNEHLRKTLADVRSHLLNMVNFCACINSVGHDLAQTVCKGYQQTIKVAADKLLC